ncbi:MAG: group II intron reverse transcriptase/maturase [Chlamydiia bacterium]|nr:group II intron reverse transcriptase/maturase [Chlamydiia bacterium]
MITKQIVSASSRKRSDWNQINWNQCEKNTKRLQARIVQALKQGRWNKVKALQRLLTRSYSAKALAVKRVTSNRGKYTPGIDGEVWKTSETKSQGLNCLKPRGYRTQPLKRIYIPKADGSRRPLGVPTMKDRAMQALYLIGLSPVAETTGDKHSYGFRPYRSAADAIEQLFILLAKKRDPQWVLEGDIRKCFDEINHDWLLKTIPMEKKILRKWLRSGFMEKKNLYLTTAGTPQGGIISPVLANMALDGLEKVIENAFGKKGSKKRQSCGVHLVRYADDFIITGKTQEILEKGVKPLVTEFLSEKGLTLSAKKTVITHIEKGFDFLGQNVRKYRGKMIIKPSKKNIKKFLGGVRDTVRKHRTATQETVIKTLSPKVRGWANYHRHVCARKVFERIDHNIFQLLWRWSKRRHPNKGLKWIKNKYFKTTITRKWSFRTTTTKKGKKVSLELFQATSIPIRRHKKIRSYSNPFDREWYEYFAKRKIKPSFKNTLKEAI